MPKPSFAKVFVEKPKPKRNNQKPKGHHTYYTSVYEPKPNQARVNNENFTRKEEPVLKTRKLESEVKLHQEEEKTIEILITDFKFAPQKIIVASGTKVTWRVDKNETIHQSSVYAMETRSFVINIKHGSEIIESELLSKDETFSYRFTKSGKYQIQCANYLQIQGIIEVSNDGSQSCMAEPAPLKELGFSTPMDYTAEEQNNNNNPWQDQLETKNSLMLFNELENNDIKGLILELSMKSASDKGGKDYSLLGEDEIIMDQNRRYDNVASGLLNQKEVNIYDSLISREFNGLKLRSRDQSVKSEKSHRIKSEDNVFIKKKKVYEDGFCNADEDKNEVERELIFDLPKEYVESKFEMFKSPALFSLKNPKDEEQKFDSTMNSVQECQIVETDENVQNVGEDKFFSFLKKELKEPVKKLKKKFHSRNNYYKRRRNNSKNKIEEDMDRISALKDFLTNRYDFAEAFN